MQVEIAINALLLTRELIAEGGLCRHRGRSRWKDQPQGEVVIEGEVVTRGSTLYELLRRRASGALISQEDRR